mmetsp:Transcript_10316/g.23583  ORF Transcript_10316/g.23583 Transcript_10316/m.23583 type:complete len:308 (+) Transcript_10316:1894-2817(+)
MHGILSELHARLVALRHLLVAKERVASGRAAQAHELRIRLGKLFEEQLLVLGKLHGELLQGGVLDQSNVRRQHPQGSCLHIRVHLLPRPVLELPLLLHQVLVVVVVELEGRVSPRAVVPAADLVHPAQRVATGQRYDLLVIEAHPVEYLTDVASSLGRIGQAAVGRDTNRLFIILPAKLERDLWPPKEFDCSTTGERPQVSLRDLGVVLLDGEEEISDDGQALVRLVIDLRLEPHRCSVTAATSILLVVRPAGMPGNPHCDGACIDLLIDQSLTDLALQSILVHDGPVHPSLLMIEMCNQRSLRPIS